MIRKVVTFFIILLFVVGIVWLSYQNSLDNAFVFDDHLAITNNNDVKNPDAHNIWTNDIWGKELSAHDSHKSYRPLLMILFRTLWSISSEARWFREVSIVAHTFASLLLVQLTSLIWGRLDISLATAILFAAHPIHVESVSAVVNMAEAFSAILIISSYILYLNTMKRNENITIISCLRLCMEIFAWILLVMTAALFKETGITACLLVLGKSCLDGLLHCLRERNVSIRNIDYKQVLFTITAGVLLYVYMSGRTLMTSQHRAEILSRPESAFYHLFLKPLVEQQRESYLDTSQLLRRAENPFAQLVGWEKIFSMMYLHCLYLTKLIYPAAQSPEYAFDCIPKVGTLTDPRLALALAAYAILGALGILGLHQALQPAHLPQSCETKAHSIGNRTGGPTVPTPPSNSNTDENASSELDDSRRSPPSAPRTQTSQALDTAPDTTTSHLHDVTITETNSIATGIPRDALLHTLLLFAVFFLPASGVVFKLGTLLAERLMYTPSLTVCMLLSAAAQGTCYYLSGLFSVRESKRASERKGNNLTWTSRVFFYTCISLLAYAYMQRTIAYNTVWKDDNTLFTESIKVCPSSAKMNLQVSKVWSQRGDLKKARLYLTKAMEIDSNFCDTGYQDVVLTAGGEPPASIPPGVNPLDYAAEKAIENLHCIYTNSAAIQLLNQIWSAQLQSVSAMNNKQLLYREFAKQGKLAEKGKVYFLAVQKYTEASNIAFEAGEADDAVEIVNRAERIVMRLEGVQLKNISSTIASTVQQEEEMEITADMRCRVFTLSGLFRTSQAASLTARKKAKAGRASQQRAVQRLHRAVFRDCREAVLQMAHSGRSGQAASHPAGRASAADHLPLAVNHLVSLWTAQMSGDTAASSGALQQSTTTPSDLAAYAQNLTAALYVTDLLRHRSSSGAQMGAEITLSTEHPQLRELCDTLARLASNAYYLAATQYLHTQDLSTSVTMFRHSLSVFIPDSVARGRETAAAAAFPSFPDSSSGADMRVEELNTIVVNKETCTTMHWLSETLASQSGFRERVGLIAEVLGYTKLLRLCLKVGAYASPRLRPGDLKALSQSLALMLEEHQE